MSAPTQPLGLDRWLALGGRCVRRAPAAIAGLVLDAVVDSLGLGRRAVGWLAHAASARTVAVAALIVVVGGAALWRYRRAAAAAPETITRRSTSCASCRCRTDTDHCDPPSTRGGPAPA